MGHGYGTVFSKSYILVHRKGDWQGSTKISIDYIIGVIGLSGFWVLAHQLDNQAHEHVHTTNAGGYGWRPLDS